MDREIVVLPLQADNLAKQYHSFFAVAGYEQRARFISEKLRPNAHRRIALGFPDQQELSFSKNVNWYRSKDFLYGEYSDVSFEDRIMPFFSEIESEKQDATICVDISSLSRFRMACMVAALAQMQNRHTVSVDFLYAVARYSAPSDKNEPIAVAKPVLPLFAGWSTGLDLPTVTIVGLGYEPDKAVGAYEYLEAANVWTFVPSGEDPRYDKAVRRANSSLLSRLQTSQVIDYSVDQPFSTFQNLESVTFGAKSSGRVVLVPFGPKIFALSCLLVSCIHRDVSVWRFSAGQYGHPVDRRAAGKITGIKVVFPPIRGV